MTENILVEFTVNTRTIINYCKSLFLDLHMQRNLPGLHFLVKKLVMEGTAQGFFLHSWLRIDHYTRPQKGKSPITTRKLVPIRRARSFLKFLEFSKTK